MPLRTCAVSYALLSTCVLLGLSCREHGAQPSPSPSAAPSASLSPSLPSLPTASAEPPLVAAPPERAQPSFERGLRASYTLKFAAEASLENSPITQFVLAGSLELLALDASPTRVLVQGSFKSPSLTTTLPGKAAEFKALEPGLTKTFLFELLPGNVLGEVWVQPTASVLVAGIQKTIAAYLQGGDRGEALFLAEEQDTTGSYQARYSRATAPGSFDKQKLRYLSAIATGRVEPSATSGLPKVDVSQYRLQFEPNGRLLSVNGTEQMTVGGMMGAVDSKSSLELVRSSVAVLPSVPDYRPLLAGLKRFATLALAKQDSNETDRLRLAGRSLDQILSALRAQGAQPTDEAGKQAYTRQRSDLFGALEALIRLKKTTIAQLTALISAADPLAPVLLDALSASGSSDAQRALVALLGKGKLDARQQKMVAISLSRAQHPTPDTTATLIRLLEDPNSRTQAMYGLGTCIRRLRADGETAHARRLLDVVLARLSSADSTLPRVTALRSLANAGDVDAYPAIEPFLSSTDEEVRAAAVESLQLVNLPQADSALERALSNDPSREVRLAATRALLVHTPVPALLDAVGRAALHDDNGHVRMGTVRVLSAWLSAHPALAAVLSKVVQSEPEAEIRQLAEASLKAQQRSDAPVR